MGQTLYYPVVWKEQCLPYFMKSNMQHWTIDRSQTPDILVKEGSHEKGSGYYRADWREGPGRHLKTVKEKPPSNARCISCCRSSKQDGKMGRHHVILNPPLRQILTFVPKAVRRQRNSSSDPLPITSSQTP